MRKLIFLMMGMALTVLVTAHEFWLQPDRFLYAAGQTISLRFWVGENFEGENWKGNRAAVEKIQLRQNDVSDELTEDLGSEPGDSLELALHEEGTAMISFRSKNKFIQLDAAKFNDYLNEDGLQTALDYRKTHQENDSAGTEFYQRSVKTILQIGKTRSNCCLKATDLPLDIVPLKNPYDQQLKDSLHFVVRFRGEPLRGQLMKIWHQTKKKKKKAESKTDDRGQISFAFSKEGKWMLSTVNMVRINDTTAQWQSYWSSCTWGYY